MDSIETISPRDFVAKLNNSELVGDCIIDVRERVEWDYYHLDEARLVPMSTLPEQLDRLPNDRELYIVCAHGVRSAHVCSYLRERGYDNVINVGGGMAAVANLRGFQYD